MKPVSGSGGSSPRRAASAVLKSSCVCCAGVVREELRVVLFLEEHGHEPILEPQLARAEDAAAEGVVLELALAVEHGVAHACAVGERLVERLDEAARGLDQHAVAHGHDGGHADLQQLGGDGLGRLLGLRGLAGFEEDERDAVIAQQRAELARCRR